MKSSVNENAVVKFGEEPELWTVANYDDGSAWDVMAPNRLLIIERYWTDKHGDDAKAFAESLAAAHNTAILRGAAIREQLVAALEVLILGVKEGWYVGENFDGSVPENSRRNRSAIAQAEAALTTATEPSLDSLLP